jgi:hypothetical protein
MSRTAYVLRSADILTSLRSAVAVTPSSWTAETASRIGGTDAGRSATVIAALTAAECPRCVVRRK